MMKKLFYGLLCLLTFAGCGKDSGVEKEGKDDKPTPEEVTLELSVSDLVFEAAGGVKVFTVACSGEWKIEGAGEWCAVDADAGNGNRVVGVTVAAYEGLEDRNVNLTVKAGDRAKVLGVTQKRKDAVVLSKDKLEVPQDGGTLSVEVKSNIDYEVSIPAEFRSWISQEPESKAVEARVYRFAIAGNEEPESRRGYIVFAGSEVKDTVYVYQAQKDRLLLVQDSYDVAVDGETIAVELKTNVDYEVEIPADADWVSRVETRALRTDRLTFAVAANGEADSRSAKVVIRDRNGSLDDTLYIRQASGFRLRWVRDKFTVRAEGKDLTVELETSIAYRVEIPADADWVSRVETRALETEGLQFRIGANGGASARYVKIAVKGEEIGLTDTLYITQQGGEIAPGDEQDITADFDPAFANVLQEKGYIPDAARIILADVRYVDRLVVSNGNLTSLRGIEHFEALTELDCSGNKLAALDVSHNMALAYLFCAANPGQDGIFWLTVCPEENNSLSVLSSWFCEGQNVVLSIVYTETVSGLSFDMVYVEGGTFRMGGTEEQGEDAWVGEKPVHSVTLSDYYIGKYEVTQGLWKAVMGTGVEEQMEKAGESDLYGVGDDYPMYYVSWDEAQEFVSKLSELTGKKYVLPTEAQWEYAARGGVKSRGYKYSGSNTIDDVAWYDGNSETAAHPVGTKLPNELGIYDMSGNVWEWCSDWYSDYSDVSQTDPTGPSSGSFRVFRGGSWFNSAGRCRVSNRHDGDPGYRTDNLGFRVALVF